MITVFIDGYYEVSGVWTLWEEQSPGRWVQGSSDYKRDSPGKGCAIRTAWHGRACKVDGEQVVHMVTSSRAPQEPMDVVALFGLRGIQHTPISIKNARVSQVLPRQEWKGQTPDPAIHPKAHMPSFHSPPSTTKPASLPLSTCFL